MELQSLFDHANEQVPAARAAGRKVWLRRCWLRGAESRLRLGSAASRVGDARAGRHRSNPKAPEFGTYGVIYIRWGKASRGSAPRRRSVLTVFPWSARVLQQWITEYRGLSPHAGDANWLGRPNDPGTSMRRG